MGKAVIASIVGFSLDFVKDRYQASGTAIINRISVVIDASLKDIKKGVHSICDNNSNK
jgi:hypothetical protein